MASREIAGRVIAITGASSGVGRAAALAFARRGAHLVLVSRRPVVLEALAEECRRLGGQALVAPADVTDAAALRDVVGLALDRYGRLDVWINNAGIGAVGSFTDTPVEAHERVIRTNLIGYINGAHAVLSHFKQHGCGVLINTLSVGSWAAAPYAVAYSASKFGLRGYSEALRGELSRYADIHVCDVFPAFLDTPGFDHGANYTGRQIKPVPPLYDPRRVAEAMVRLVRRPRSAVTVGSTATLIRAGHALSPGLSAGAFAQGVQAWLTQAPRAPHTDGSLFESTGLEGRIDGGFRRPAARSLSVGAAAAVSALVLIGWLASRSRT